MGFYFVGELGAVLLCVAAVAGSNLPDTPTRNASEYRLRYRDPSGCDPDTCDYFMGIDTNEENSSFLDFYLVGQATGWVALGLTKSENMFSADVIGCSIDENRTEVLALDTFNPASERTNELDDSEKDTNGHPGDVVQFSREFVDGRIICVFSRLIEGVDPNPQDLLMNESYYLQFGVGNKGRDTANIAEFSHHEKTPTISKKQYNPASDSGEIGGNVLEEKLITAHGILMLVAWPILSFTAIFFAVWMKPALPNGQWLQVHRAFNLAGLLVGAAGFILVFVAYKGENPPGLIDELGSKNKIGTAHFSLGILIMAMQIANPIISLCRCKPDGKYRWIFVLLHAIIIGHGLQILAYVNAGIGVSIFSKEKTDFGDLTLLWIYLAFAVFSIVLTCILFAVFTGEAAIFKVDALNIAPSLVKMFWKCCCNKYTELKTGNQREPAEDPLPEDPSPFLAIKPNAGLISPPPAPHKLASPDAPLRWLGLVAFLLVVIPAVLTLSVLMIVKRN